MSLTPPPPPATAPAPRQLPPLTFAGFRAGMPIADARDVISASRGNLVCKSTTDVRMRECTGSMQFQGIATPVRILISSINDSAAVIVLSSRPSEAGTRGWVDSLTTLFGTPNQERQPGVRSSWQWIRRRQMLRVILRGPAQAPEVAITLTDGPLLDGLASAGTKKPD